jgi:hypothetical protein
MFGVLFETLDLDIIKNRKFYGGVSKAVATSTTAASS